MRLCFQFRRRTDGDDFAVIDDRDAVGDAVGFVHVVRGQEDGHAFVLVQIFDVSPKLIAALRVEAERRLVEKQDFRRVQKSARNFQPPLHAARKCLHEVVFALPQLEELQQKFRALLSHFARHVVERAVQFHVFDRGQILVEAGILKHDAESLPHFVLLLDGIHAVDLQRSAGGSQQSRQHFDGCGFSGAVRAEKGENFAFGHVKRHVVYGCKVTKLLHQLLYSDHREAILRGNRNGRAKAARVGGRLGYVRTVVVRNFAY